MSIELAETSNLTEESFSSSSILQSLEGFQSVRNRILRWMLRFGPWFILVIVVAQLYDILPFSVIYASGLITATLMFFAFQVMLRRISETLSSLWHRRIIAAEPRTEEVENELGNLGNTSLGEVYIESSVTSNELEIQYQKFIKGFETSLNHNLQFVFGFSLAFISILRVFLTHGSIKNLWFTSGWGMFLLEMLGQPLISFIVGVMIWRMFVTGVLVWQLGKQFDLNPQLGHPDKCGGFELVGNLCLWNALILSFPGIFLGAWIIIGEYIPLFSSLVFILIIISGVSFFWPLWNIHLAMKAKRDDIQRQLDLVAQSINQLQLETLNRVRYIQPEEGEKLIKQLKLMQEVYLQNQGIPVWPFNLGIIVKLVTSQAIPLLSLLGFGKPIATFISDILNSLVQPPTP